MNSRGAYGLILPDLPDQELLNPAPAEWTTWSLQAAAVTETQEEVKQSFTADHAKLNLMPTGFIEIDRVAAQTVVYQYPMPTTHAFAHPLLASTAAVTAEWNQRLTFHGGTFLDDDSNVWGVLGDRQAGKSSFLGWCHVNKIPVFADDWIVTDGNEVMAGPRCIDLRESAAQHFDIGTDIGVVGTRRRWREVLPTVNPVAQLKGWIVLRWDDSIGVRRLEPFEKGPILTMNRGLKIAQAHPLPWLHALAKPMYEFSRPMDWQHLEQGMESLMLELSE